MSNFQFIKSSQNIPTHGVFETFSVLKDGVELFHWSDNDGLNCYIHDISKYPEVETVFQNMVLANDEANRLWREREEDEIIYSRDGRTSEFGDQWETL